MAHFEENVRNVIHAYKSSYFDDPGKYSVCLESKGEIVGRLRPVPAILKAEAANDAVLQTEWRNMHKDSFFVPPFTATVERTLKWLGETYVGNDTIIIFIVESYDGIPIGHLGFSDFDFSSKLCEYGRLLRGAVASMEQEKNINILHIAQKNALKWAFDVFGLDKIFSRVFAENWLALRFNYGCGFYPVENLFIEKPDGRHEIVRIEVTRKALKC